MQSHEISEKAKALMPGVLSDLEDLVAIPSIAFPGYPEDPVHEMASATLERFRQVGFTNARFMDMPSGYPGYPPIYGVIDGPEGSPVVMLYVHYDVQPAPPEQGWTCDPWAATHRDGRIFGRGAADDKGGLVSHLGTLRVFDGKSPCTVKLIVEGMEETESTWRHSSGRTRNCSSATCSLFATWETSGSANLCSPQPSGVTSRASSPCGPCNTRCIPGVFGDPVPDAMMALTRLLGTLHDENADVAVAGVTSGEWAGADMSTDDLRASADLADGVSLVGTGTVADRLWEHPSISAIGVDMTWIAGSSNVLIPEAKAKISMRIVPGTDPKEELDALVAHLESHAPWNAQVTVQRTKEAPPFRCDTSGPGYAAARAALEVTFGGPVGDAGSGGSIPLLRTLQKASPGSEFILWGPEDTAMARIHASDEGVDPTEIEKLIVAQAVLLQLLADNR